MNIQTLGRVGPALPAAGLLLALLLTPPTRGLVMTQVGMSLAGRDPFLTALPHLSEAPLPSERYAQSHPDDYPIQLVRALDAAASAPTTAQAGGTVSDHRLAHLRALEARFPNTPSLRANILRFAMTGGTWTASEGDWALDGLPKPKHGDQNPPPPAQLAAFDADAAQGERLDPDNAYFPFMRAVGLWTAKRKTDALAAIERASHKPVWREYIEDEVAGHWRAAQMNGGTAALNRAAIAGAILLPHLARLRGLARAATYQAVVAEQAGRPQDGMAIRLALLRCGETVQTQAPTQIGSLVGSGIGVVALCRPGGAPPSPTVGDDTGDANAQKRLDAFCAYAARLNRPDAAREARQTDTVRRQTRAIFGRAAGLSVFGLRPLWRLTRWWAADFVVLANIVLMLTCGLLAVPAARLPRGDGGEAAEGAVALARALFGVGAFLALALAWPWQTRPVISLFAQTQALLGGGGADPFAGARVVSLLGVVAAPLVTLLGAVAVGLTHRGGLFSGVGRGFRAATLPAVCVLLIVYGVLVQGTARQERAVNDALARITQNEGHFMAQLTGQTWPEKSQGHSVFGAGD